MVAIVSVLTPRVEAGDPVFFAVVDDGIQPEIWTIGFDGTVLAKVDITDNGHPAGFGNQALAVGYDGFLWGDGASQGQGGQLFKWSLPLTTGEAVSSQSLLLMPQGLLNPSIGFAPDTTANKRLLAAAAGNGGLWSFKPNNIVESTFLGGPLPGNARALAKFPDDNGIYYTVADQLFRHDFGTGQTTDFGTFQNGLYRAVQGLTAVPDDITNGGTDTLYGLDFDKDVLLRMEPSTTSENVVTVIPLSEDIADHLGVASLSLTYYLPCDGEAWSDCDDNGAPDACDIAQDAGADCNANGVLDSCETWTDLGQALPGVAGEPVFTGSGTLVGGDPVTLSLTNTVPNTSAWLFLGFSELSAPFKGGVLVPSPDITLVFQVNIAGFLSLSAPWPSGFPSCFRIWFQWWMLDASGPQGITASNALVALTP